MRLFTQHTTEAVLSPAARDATSLAGGDELFGIRRHPRLTPDVVAFFEKNWRIRQSAEKTLETIVVAQGHLRGYCICCRAPTRFGVSFTTHPDTQMPAVDFQENLMCDSCGLVARLRLCAAEVMRYVEPMKSTVYLTEQTTPLFLWLQVRIKHLIGSEYVNEPAEYKLAQEYLDYVHGPGRMPLRREDVTALSFGDGSLDALMSLEVLEHVPDYQQALREFARVLRPGGVAILSAPFGIVTKETVVRAVLNADGTITHLLEPEYHGDPASGNGKGCLCFYHFGWDILDDIREAGFASVDYLDVWEPAFGFIGGICVFVARR